MKALKKVHKCRKTPEMEEQTETNQSWLQMRKIEKD